MSNEAQIETAGVECHICGISSFDHIHKAGTKPKDFILMDGEVVTPSSEPKEWRQRLNKIFFGGVPIEEMGSNQVDEQKLIEFISAEKSLSYRQGLEKAKEILLRTGSRVSSLGAIEEEINKVNKRI